MRRGGPRGIDSDVRAFAGAARHFSAQTPSDFDSTDAQSFSP